MISTQEGKIEIEAMPVSEEIVPSEDKAILSTETQGETAIV